MLGSGEGQILQCGLSQQYVQASFEHLWNREAFLLSWSTGCSVQTGMVCPRQIEAGSMTIFWTQNRALKTISLARVPMRASWNPVDPSSSLWWDPNRARWDPVGSALLYIGPKSSSVARWDLVGPTGTQHPVCVCNTKKSDGEAPDVLKCPLGVCHLEVLGTANVNR